MIIFGIYPDLVESEEYCNPLQQLRHVTDKLLPTDVILHLLPPYPSSGDGGFAADDWFSVRSDLGSWRDIVNWASTRKLILDGIYNHVGFAHPWAKEFFSSPSEQGPIYAYRCANPPSSQLSPRGGSVFHKYEIKGDVWQTWQTFSEKSLDIRLSLPSVRSEISRHLNFLANSGIFGVRLDGCAYYGHDLDVEQFHNPSALYFARSLAREAHECGLFVLAQLDADASGSSYFQKKEGWSVPVVDYAYSAVLVRTLLSESASAMERHVQRTRCLPCNVIRPPRTHDGILLQSDLLTNDELNDLARLCDQWNLPVRKVGEERYEINSSLPFICSLGVDEQSAWQRILLVMTLTGFLPGIPYFYFPIALCDIPEHRISMSDTDPRSLNRSHPSAIQINNFLKSQRSQQLRAVLDTVNRIRALYSDDDVNTIIPVSEHPDSVLLVFRNSNHCVFACNFSTSQTALVKLPEDMHFEWGIRASNCSLEPLGFGIWSQDIPVK